MTIYKILVDLYFLWTFKVSDEFSKSLFLTFTNTSCFVVHNMLGCDCDTDLLALIKNFTLV